MPPRWRFSCTVICGRALFTGKLFRTCTGTLILYFTPTGKTYIWPCRSNQIAKAFRLGLIWTTFGAKGFRVWEGSIHTALAPAQATCAGNADTKTGRCCAKCESFVSSTFHTIATVSCTFRDKHHQDISRRISHQNQFHGRPDAGQELAPDPIVHI